MKIQGKTTEHPKIDINHQASRTSISMLYKYVFQRKKTDVEQGMSLKEAIFIFQVPY